MQHNNLPQNATKCHKMPQNCKNLYATVPKTGFLISRINGLLILGHAILSVFFDICTFAQIYDMQYAHKIIKNISSPNLAKMLSFVIILLSSRGFDACPVQCPDIICHATNDRCKKLLLDLPNLLSFCYHCY